MKFLITVLSILVLNLDVNAQRVIDNPGIGATNVEYLKVKKILLSDTATVFHFWSKSGMTFRLSSESFLQDSKGGEKLVLKRAGGFVLDKFITIDEGKNDFTLTFPPVKKGVSKIDFSEGDCEGCFKILDIALHPVPKRKLLQQAFRGNWYKTDGSKDWVLGLYDSVAVYRNQVWKYTYTEKGKKAVLNLGRNGIQVSLSAELKGKKGSLELKEPDGTGILLTSNKQQKLADRFDDEFSSVLKTDSAVYRGLLGAYSPRLGYKTGKVFVNNNFTGEQESYLITVEEDGSFYSKFPMHYPQLVFVDFPGNFMTVFCEPGKEVFQYLDLAKVAQEEQFMGHTALINEELRAADQIIRGVDHDEKLRTIHGFSPAQYREYTLANGARLLDSLEAYRTRNPLSKKAWSLLEMQLKFRTASELFEYNWNIEAAHRKANKIADKIRKQYVKEIILDSAYFDYVRSLPLNDERAFIADNYHSFINRLRFAHVSKSKNLNLTLSAIIAGLRKDGQFFSPDEELLIKKMGEAERIALADTAMAKRENSELSKAIEPFSKKYEKAISAYINRKYQEKDIERLVSVFQLKEGLLSDVLFSQAKSSEMTRSFTALSENEKKYINNRIKTPQIASALLSLDKEIVDKIAENKKKVLVINEVPKTTSDKLLNSILEKYRGNVVYIDFWATWCAPCISGIRNIAPLKEELKNENVVFLYITNQTSPFETYKNMMPDIKGQHYRVSADEWNYLTTKFKISGIPHYMLVDKKGQIVDENLAHMENEGIKKRLSALK